MFSSEDGGWEATTSVDKVVMDCMCLSFVWTNHRKRSENYDGVTNPIGNLVESTRCMTFPIITKIDMERAPERPYGSTARLLNRLLKTVQERR